jgi:hypothetical protein
MGKLEDGYYWFRDHADGSTFIALLEEGNWYVPGVYQPVNSTLQLNQLIGPAPRPNLEGLN